MAGNPGIDLYSSKEIAEKVENIGIVKANLPLRTMFMPGILANTFTGFGALHFHAGRERHLARFRGDAGIRRTGFPARPDPGRGGRAELFTGHNFLLMARAEGDLPFALLARNWPIVYMANAVGALGMVLLVFLSHHPDMNGGAIAQTYMKVAVAKTATPFAAV